jgi:hypothetical protein
MDPAIAPRLPADALAPGASGEPGGHGAHAPAPVDNSADAPVTRRQRLTRAGGLAAAVGVTAYVGLVDPSGGGAYPLCPSRVLLGVDCPACGGLRGTHDLLNGDIVGAFDHNLLLPVWLVVYAVAFVLWLRPLVGRAMTPVRVPRRLVTAGIVVAVGFTVLRNLPFDSLEFLASGTST